MIRRMLIARLRRHTRLARALAGRAPLASRTAVDQPILWAIGRVPVPARRARAPVFAGLSPEPPAGSVALFPTAPPESVADGSVFSATPAAGDDDPFSTPLPSSVASGDASAPAVLSRPAQSGGGESAAGARAPVATPPPSVAVEEAPAPAVSSQPATDSGSETHSAEPTTPEAAQAPAFRVPSESPDVSAFDRSPAAWMERLRADDQRRRQATSSITSVSRVAPEHLGTFAAALSGKEEPLGVSHAPESETHSPDHATSPVAPLTAAGADRAEDVPFIAPHDASAAQAPSQPVDPAAAIVNAARAWVSQRMQERSSAPVQPPPAPPAAPKPQPQSRTPVEMRVARPPRFVEERTALPSTGSGSAMGADAPSRFVEERTALPSTGSGSAMGADAPSRFVEERTALPSTGSGSAMGADAPLPEPAPATETLRETDQPSSAGTPAFDRSVEAWMERLRADERRRRQKEATEQGPDRSPEETARPAPRTPPAGALWSSDAMWAAPGSEQQRAAPQPISAPQPDIAAPQTRTTRFVPPVSATVRPTASGSARFPAHVTRSAPSLSESNRRFLRAAIGVDPATVHVLHGPEAARVAAAYRADAVTLGDDVALAPGRGDETAEGLGLLAHELTHVARRRDPTAIPPIARSPEQRPGLRPAPPEPTTDEEALARAVEAQTIQAARMRFAPPVLPARTGATAAPAPKAPAPVRSAEPAEDAPAAPERARWGNLPAPWEPLPDWLAPSGPAAEAPPLPVMTIAPAPPVLTAPPHPGAPVARTAETARTLPAVQQTETTAPSQEQSPAPDLDDLARQVYAVLKRRLAAERRRNGW